MLLSSKSCPITCNFHSPPKTLTLTPKAQLNLNPKPPNLHNITLLLRTKLQSPHLCHDSINQDPKLPTEEESGLPPARIGDGDAQGNDWSTSILLFGFWAGLMYYVFKLIPDQTPYRDMYFLQKLLNLKGDDGFKMNEVLVALWYIMGLWPLVYNMLLLPSGRSTKSKVPVWPFLVLSCFGGAYALIPYFVLWKPPPPAVGEDEISRWPLNFLESKITAAIHATSLDFTLPSTFAPFRVYNDMTARKWVDKGSWLLPLALIPFLGPSLYLLLRPPLSALPTRVPSAETESY